MRNTSQYVAAALTVRAAAKYLSVSTSTLNRCRKDGVGPAYVRLGKRTVRYRLCDLDAYLAECVTPVTS